MSVCGKCHVRNQYKPICGALFVFLLHVGVGVGGGCNSFSAPIRNWPRPWTKAFVCPIWFCPMCPPRILSTWRTKQSQHQIKTYRSFPGTERSIPAPWLIPLTSGFPGSTLACSSDRKAVLTTFLPSVPAELRAREWCFACLLSTTVLGQGRRLPRTSVPHLVFTLL